MPRSVTVMSRGRIVAGRDEKFQFHLFELARAEGEIARVNFVAERLADLCDAEGNLLARDAEHVLKLREDDLCGLGTKIRDAAGFFDGADVSFEHEIKLARLGEVVRAAFGAFRLR